MNSKRAEACLSAIRLVEAVHTNEESSFDLLLGTLDREDRGEVIAALSDMVAAELEMQYGEHAACVLINSRLAVINNSD
jgi:hypothetical protein